MKPRAIIMADGKAERWGNHLGVPKQLIEIEGETLIARAVRQLTEREFDVIVTTHDKTIRAAAHNAGAFQVYAPQGNVDEIGKFLSPLPVWEPDGSPTLFVYGDCYFTDEAMDTIVNKARTVGDFEFFGRQGASRVTGKAYGEIFAVVMSNHQQFINACQFIRNGIRDGNIKRGGAWELYHKMVGLPLEEPTIKLNGNFTSIDDFTEDFDTPKDYELWSGMRRRSKTGKLVKDTAEDVHPVIVLGTGRSGTSAIAMMLHYLGVNMGDDMLAADGNNPNGHFEVVFYTSLNRKAAAGTITKEQWVEQSINEAKKREQEHGAYRWGWKIPLNTNYIKEYKQMFPNAKYVVGDRPLQESIESAMRAYGWEEQHARDWLEVRSNLLHSEVIGTDLPHLVVGFHELLENPENEAKRLCEFLDITDPTDFETAHGIINNNEKKAKVLICIPNLGNVNTGLMLTVIAFLANQSAAEIHLYTPQNLRPHDMARNTCVKHFLENTDCTHLFFVDADTVPPHHALVSLLRANKPVVGGCTPTYKFDPNDGQNKKQFMIMRYGTATNGDEGLITVWGRGIEQIDMIGTSCLLIRRDVLEQLPKPHFKFQYNEEGLVARGEDIHFCDLLREAGIPLYADFDVVCHHYKEILL